MTVSQDINRKRLRWIEHARQGILRALEEDMVDPEFRAHSTVDPLRFILKVTLRAPFGKELRESFRTYLRCWAEEFGCELPIINIKKNSVQAEVLTKQRHWSRDELGRFKNKTTRRFERRPR